MSDEFAKETTVGRGHVARIPAMVRRRLGIEPGDVLEWRVKGGALSVRLRKRRRGAFGDFKPYDFGQATNATRDHDAVDS